ncbi:DUF4861 family protein [Saccharicrinis sp. GN24d3]|uniref:DUF4861 family protein n=1 Tax=Saccharicrinis sp. GN24d3 TaxID=3458416 RepID=UPI00403605AE
MMNMMLRLISFMSLLLLLGSCDCSQNQIKVSVTNPLNMDRGIETVELALAELKVDHGIIVLDEKSGMEIRSQLLDKNQDGVSETVIFQTALKASETKNFVIKEGKTELEPTEVKTFARFVPERTDDFTWENDKVAFRVYGPEAQRMVEAGEKGGTLSGGVDCWLKKVDYSIIDKWYKGNTEKIGYYHNDHGEGLDNYHVGPSCGCGGTGVMVDGELFPHLNYTGYKVLTNGPIRTEFDLDYAPYLAGESTIQERKKVSIDLGSNLTKFVIEVEGTDTLTAGITLHDKLGEISVDEESGWASYWSPHFGEELGNAIVADAKYFAGTSKIVSDVKDKSHLLLHLKVIDGKVEYYTGFAWSGSKQFKNKQAWEEYLTNFRKTINKPLVTKVK